MKRLPLSWLKLVQQNLAPLTVYHRLEDKNTWHLDSTCVVDAALKYFYIVGIIHLIFIIALWGRYYYHLHVIDEEFEGWRKVQMILLQLQNSLVVQRDSDPQSWCQSPLFQTLHSIIGCGLNGNESLWDTLNYSTNVILSCTCW